MRKVRQKEQKSVLRRVPPTSDAQQSLDVVEFIEGLQRGQVVDVYVPYLVADAHEQRVVQLEETELHMLFVAGFGLAKAAIFCTAFVFATSRI